MVNAMCPLDTTETIIRNFKLFFHIWIPLHYHKNITQLAKSSEPRSEPREASAMLRWDHFLRRIGPLHSRVSIPCRHSTRSHKDHVVLPIDSEFGHTSDQEYGECSARSATSGTERRTRRASESKELSAGLSALQYYVEPVRVPWADLFDHMVSHFIELFSIPWSLCNPSEALIFMVSPWASRWPFKFPTT